MNLRHSAECEAAPHAGHDQGAPSGQARRRIPDGSPRLGIVWDPTPVPGRVNHFAYFVDSRESLLRAADVFLNQDIAIEFGPGRHGMGEQDYLYVRDPSGMRVEINAGGYRNYEPDWEPVRFEPQQGSNVFYRNLAMPTSMFESFPPVGARPADDAEAQQATGLFV